MCFFFSSRRRHTRLQGDWSSDVCSSDLLEWRASVGEPRLPARFDRRVHRTVKWTQPPAVVRLVANRRHDEEIGRASCRETGEGRGGGGRTKKSGRKVR